MPKLHCEGWWEQRGLGRQPMSNLIVDFANGELQGTGEDVVGRFVLNGRIEGEQLFIRKQYLGQHSIDYHGTTNGEGVYFGEWGYDGFTGGKWSIRFRALAGDGDAPIAEIGHG